MATGMRSLSLRAIGALSALGCVALWVAFLFFNPYGRVEQGINQVIGFGMTGLWLAGAFAALRGSLWTQLAVGLLAFVPVGFYLLLTPGVFRWIGVLDAVYLAATGTAFFLQRRA